MNKYVSFRCRRCCEEFVHQPEHGDIKYQGLESKPIYNICFHSLTDCADGSHQHGLGWVCACLRVCACNCGVAWLSLCMYCQVNERLPLVSKLRSVYLFCSVSFSCHERPMNQRFLQLYLVMCAAARRRQCLNNATSSSENTWTFKGIWEKHLSRL